MLSKCFVPLVIDLRLFDGGAAAGGDGGNTGGSQAAPADAGQAKTGGSSRVVYGKQSDAAGVSTSPAAQATDAGQAKDAQVTSNTLEERRKAYQDFVNGEYKDIHTQEVQRVIDQRFRETKGLQERVDAMQPVLDMLAQRYKVDGGDAKAIMEALDKDSSYWSEAADEAGMSVEQYKKFQQLQRDNAALLRSQERQQGQERMQQQLQKWYGEAEAMTGKYPGFDLNAEVKNPQFLTMIKSGVPVEHAYKVIHMDELMNNAVQATAAQTEKSVVDNIRAKGARPAENGLSGQSGVIVKNDVSKLTKKDRAEIARRVARGEMISW